MVTVIIPTYNRAQQLSVCLDAIARQDYGEKFELIIVDDGSSDNTQDIVALFVKKNKKINTKYVFQKNLGCATARNTGIKNSSGEYLFFTDDDCIVPLNWIAQILEVFKNHEDISVVGGRIFSNHVDNKYIDAYEKCSTLSFDTDFKTYNYLSNSPLKNPAGDTGNICYRRIIFDKLGLFNSWTRKTALIDFEFKLRIFYASLKILYIPITVKHCKKMDLFNFIKKSFFYGFAKSYLDTRFDLLFVSPNLERIFLNLNMIKNKYPKDSLFYIYIYLFIELAGSKFAKLIKVKSDSVYKINVTQTIVHKKENVTSKFVECYYELSQEEYSFSNDSIQRQNKAIDILEKTYKTAIISIIIPFYNRPEYVNKFFIESINNIYCSDSVVELIFIDDGSTDNTLKVLEASKNKFRFYTRVLTQKNGGPASARNLGIRNATGDYIFMTDSDVLVPKYWLREFLAAFEYNKELVLVGGGQINANPYSIFDKWRNGTINRRKNFFVTNSNFIEKHLPYDSSNMAIRNHQNLFFNETYKFPGYEDFDFVYNIKKQNLMVCYIPLFVKNIRNMNKNDYFKMVKVRSIGYNIFINSSNDYQYFITKYRVLSILFSGKKITYKILDLKSTIEKFIFK